MAGRDSAPCNPSMQAPKPACRRPNQHTGGQGWPWTSNSPTCVLGLQLFTAMFILCNAGIRTRASCVLGMLDSQSTTVHIFKTKKKLKTTHKFWLCADPQRYAAPFPLATVSCVCLHPASLRPLQLPCASLSTVSLLLFMWCSHGIRSGPGKLTALQPELYRSWWIRKLFIYYIKERKEPQAIPLMFCMERECGRL